MSYLTWTSQMRSLYPGIYADPGIYAEGYIVFAFPFVRSYVRSFVRPSRSWNLRQSFPQSCIIVSQVEYISRTTHQKAFIFGSYVLGGSASIQWLSRVGLDVNILDTFKKGFTTFLLWKQLMQIVGQTWLNLVTLTCGSWSEGQHDLYFAILWYCLILYIEDYLMYVHHTLGLLIS